MLNRENIQEMYGVSPMQRNMIFAYSMNPDSSIYVEQMDFSIGGTIDPERFRQALQKIVDKYDAFRTVYSFKSAKDPVQVVLKHGEPVWETIDMSGEGTEKLEEFKKEDLAKGFDLNKDILIRGTLLKFQEREYHLIITFHHIIIDGWSLGIVLNELFQIYNNEKQEISAVQNTPASFSTYIKWLETRDKQEAAEYWRKYLEGYEKNMGIPKYTDIGKFRKPNAAEYKRSTYIFEIPEELTARINAIAQKCNVTVNVIIQAVWAVILQKYNYADDVLYGMVTSGRSPEVEGIENMIGLFINTIPLRVTSDEKSTFLDLCKQIQQKIFCSLPYEYYPLSDIQNQSELKNNLMNHVMAFENYPLAEQLQNSVSEENAEYQIRDVSIYESSNYDFNVIINPLKKIRFTFIYNENVYYEDTLKTIEGNIVEVMKKICDNPEIAVRSLDICTQNDYDFVRNEIEALKTEYPEDKTVDGIMRELAKDQGEAVALIFRDREVTYSELDRLSDQIQSDLQEKGITEGDTVGIMAARSVELIAAMLGIMKVGAKYVVLDRANSEERSQFILEDANAKVVCAEDIYFEKIPAGIEKISMKDFAVLREECVCDTGIHTCPESASHIIYTSGSTGKPKGCVITHKNIVSLVLGQDYMKFQENSYFVFQLNPSFDASTLEIWEALLNGKTLIIIEEKGYVDLAGMKKAIGDRQKVTLIMTTALFHRICDEDCDFLKGIDEVGIGGEALNVLCVKKAMEEVPGLDIKNLYGPTENTAVSTAYLVGKDDLNGDRLPIGRAINNSYGYVLDKGLNILPVGARGELCLGGDGVVSSGYLNREELTKERFIPDPLDPSKIIYRTGDIVRCLPDGSFDYYNREDSQVKLHGFRIEMGEIEAAMQTLPGILQVVVMVRDIASDSYLTAYYVAKEEGDTEQWKELLKQKLAKYMIPAFFIRLDEIPMTVRGKIDKSKLPLPVLEKTNTNTAVREISSGEELIRTVCAEILNTDAEGIDIDANFFDIGITSLSIMSMKYKLSKLLNRDIPVAKFFEHSTVARLNQYLAEPEDTAEETEEEESTEERSEGNKINRLLNLKRHMEDEE